MRSNSPTHERLTALVSAFDHDPLFREKKQYSISAFIEFGRRAVLSQSLQRIPTSGSPFRTNGEELRSFVTALDIDTSIYEVSASLQKENPRALTAFLVSVVLDADLYSDSTRKAALDSLKTIYPLLPVESRNLLGVFGISNIDRFGHILDIFGWLSSSRVTSVVSSVSIAGAACGLIGLPLLVIKLGFLDLCFIPISLGTVILLSTPFIGALAGFYLTLFGGILSSFAAATAIGALTFSHKLRHILDSFSLEHSDQSMQLKEKFASGELPPLDQLPQLPPHITGPEGILARELQTRIKV